jgi:hypothetical protein
MHVYIDLADAVQAAGPAEWFAAVAGETPRDYGAQAEYRRTAGFVAL